MAEQKTMKMINKGSVSLPESLMQLIRTSGESIPTGIVADSLIRERKAFVVEVLPRAEGKAADLILYNVPIEKHRVGYTIVARDGNETQFNRKDSFSYVALVSFYGPSVRGALPTAAYYIRTDKL